MTNYASITNPRGGEAIIDGPPLYLNSAPVLNTLKFLKYTALIDKILKTLLMKLLNSAKLV